MASEVKRFLILGLVALGASVALLLPLSRMQARIRPHNVPATAQFGRAGQGQANWIDCQQGLSINLQYCMVYTRDGQRILAKGTFTRSPIRTMANNVFYDGFAIHWRNGIVLEPQHLECASGGTRQSNVPDCQPGKPL